MADDTTMKTIINNLIGKNWCEFSLSGQNIQLTTKMNILSSIASKEVMVLTCFGTININYLAKQQSQWCDSHVNKYNDKHKRNVNHL